VISVTTVFFSHNNSGSIPFVTLNTLFSIVAVVVTPGSQLTTLPVVALATLNSKLES